MPTLPNSLQNRVERSKVAYFFSLPRPAKQAIMLFADVAAVSLAYYLAYMLRLRSFTEPFLVGAYWWLTLLGLIALSVMLFAAAGQYKTIVHYMSGSAVNRVLACILASSLSLYVFRWAFTLHMPRSVPILYFVFMSLFYGGMRLMVHNLYVFEKRNKVSPHVIIYGAGRCGTELAAALQTSNRYFPVAFIDDDTAKQTMLDASAARRNSCVTFTMPM